MRDQNTIVRQGHRRDQQVIRAYRCPVTGQMGANLAKKPRRPFIKDQTGKRSAQTVHQRQIGVAPRTFERLLEVRFALADDALSGDITLTGPTERFSDLAWLEEETARFLRRAAVGSQ